MIVTWIAGYWLMHCHLAHHQSDGMNLVMQEGEIQEMAPLPPNFPTCNNFRVNPNQFLSSLKNQERMLWSKGWYTLLFPSPFHYYIICIWFWFRRTKYVTNEEQFNCWEKHLLSNRIKHTHLYLIQLRLSKLH